MILSILIPSLESRAHLLNVLIENINNQIKEHYAVEVITLVDNKQITTGAKRQRLLEMSKGKYIVFIDDDDYIPEYYVEEMLKGCSSDCDCMAINGHMTTNNTNKIDWRISKDYQNITIKENGFDIYLRKTNHITAVKRDIALIVGFPNKSNAEDKAYSDGINPYLKTEYKIHLPMYHYKYSTLNKEYK